MTGTSELGSPWCFILLPHSIYLSCSKCHRDRSSLPTVSASSWDQGVIFITDSQAPKLPISPITSSSANSSFCSDSDCQSGRPLLPPICVVGPPLLYVAVNFNLHSSHVSLSAVFSLLLLLMVVSDKPTWPTYMSLGLWCGQYKALTSNLGSGTCISSPHNACDQDLSAMRI